MIFNKQTKLAILIDWVIVVRNGDDVNRLLLLICLYPLRLQLNTNPNQLKVRHTGYLKPPVSSIKRLKNQVIPYILTPYCYYP